MRNILESIHQFNRDRLRDILPLKYAAMGQNPFRFLRGTCHLFYEDFSQKAQIPDERRVWICGDLHLENFGTYKGDNRLVYFDLNDFDEAVLAPPSWELARLLCSIHVAMHTMGLPAREGDQLARRCLQQYTNVLQEGKALVSEAATSHGLLKYFIRQVTRRTQKSFIKSHTRPGKHPAHLLCDGEKAFSLPANRKKEIASLIENWSKNQTKSHKSYRILDVAQRIAGTGSLGLERYILLAEIKGSAEKINLLDLKEAVSSSLTPYLTLHQPQWKNQAGRVVSIQKRVQHVSPALITVIPHLNRSFVLRELQPTADKMDLALCRGKENKLAGIMDTMAIMTASGQLRSGGQQGSSTTDELKSFGANKTWQTEILKYAKSYSGQVLKDYARYLTALKKGFFSENKNGST
ncbi:MAG TPA: DUF2252 family protein [Chitinophagaceae bacterium]|nr:DUF2252 family protein [Chitinophagaceae bacterium]